MKNKPVSLNFSSTCQLAPLHAADNQVLPDIGPITLSVDRFHQLKPKQILPAAKEKFRSLFVVQHGALKTTQVDVWGKEHIRGFYFAGEIFGFEAIPYGQHQYIPSALSEACVAEVHFQHFLDVLHDQHKLDMQKYILILLSQLLNKRTYLTAVTAEQRVAYFLLDLSERIYSPKKTQNFTLPMTRYDIGSYLNLSPETISRILTAMKQSDLIAANYKQISILQPDRILDIAKGLYSI